ncbi:hypothetical protein L873DRAFT_1790661 [Choiromyces venosus 120613-1]|uniref:DUF8035 domain-containing protein n=1 Tax=Choiromyces venosus 120613-1 TaxID=1336337 RepID=A0A3N4JID9_9PEZI|nr:hypothetical protein L873DRAFT_1790661 [Choiromyces venosus 120613-1]
MNSYRRQQSPHRNRRKHHNDPHRMSTGSLPGGGPDSYYGGPPPAAPPAPAPPYHNTYSVPQSPISSNESIGMYPGSRPGPMHHPPPHHGYQPAPAPPAPAPAPPPPGMRGGDGGHMFNGGRPNAGRGAPPGIRQNVIHQQHPQHMSEYEPHPEYDYRSHPPRGPPMTQRESRSSSRTRDRDLSPGSAGGSSNFSGGSFEPIDRHKSFVVPSDSRRPNSREYRLNGPLPGERDYRGGGGTVYHPAGGNRPVLGGERRRERSRSRGPRGLGLSSASGDGFSDEYFDDQHMYDPRPDGRRMVSSGNPGSNAGALVRSRSRSAPPESRAMIPQRPPASESEGSSSSSSSGTTPQAGTGIRLEYAGNSVDITYTGSGGKPVSIGSITINTTARTTAVPISPTTQAITAPPMQAITAPPSAPAPAALPAPPPPPVQPVMIPPPPAPSTVLPPGIEPLVLPPPPAPMMPGSMPGPMPGSMPGPMPGSMPGPMPGSMPGPMPGSMPGPIPGAMPRQDMSLYDNDRGGVREHMFRGMEALALEPRYDDRGRDREIMPPAGMRALSHRRRSQSRGRKSADEELRWTKISRDIVARRAVEVKGYDYEEQPDSIMVFQVLNEGQIDELIDLSERIRSGAVRVIRRDDPGKEHKRHRRRHSQRRPSSHSRPQSLHGYPATGGPGPSANRPPPAKPALVIPAPDPPSAEAPAPPPQQPGDSLGGRVGRPTENPHQPGTYIGYSRNPPRSAAGSGPY